MVDVYATLIINKKRDFDSIPSRLKAAVRDKLKELGYDTNGDPLPENEEE